MPEATNISQDSSAPRSAGVLAGRNWPVFSAEVEQDRVAVEDRGVAVDDGRDLGVGIDGEEGRRVLLALARVDGNELVGQAHFLQAQGHFSRVGREVVIEFDHDVGPAVAAAFRRRMVAYPRRCAMMAGRSCGGSFTDCGGRSGDCADRRGRMVRRRISRDLAGFRVSKVLSHPVRPGRARGRNAIGCWRKRRSCWAAFRFRSICGRGRRSCNGFTNGQPTRVTCCGAICGTAT